MELFECSVCREPKTTEEGHGYHRKTDGLYWISFECDDCMNTPGVYSPEVLPNDYHYHLGWAPIA